MTMTMAETVAETLGNDGSPKATARALPSGCSLGEYLGRMGARLNKGVAEWEVWEFDDGSALMVGADYWDVRAEGCEGACWEGAGCYCEE